MYDVDKSYIMSIGKPATLFIIILELFPPSRSPEESKMFIPASFSTGTVTLLQMFSHLDYVSTIRNTIE